MSLSVSLRMPIAIALNAVLFARLVLVPTADALFVAVITLALTVMALVITEDRPRWTTVDGEFMCGCCWQWHPYGTELWHNGRPYCRRCHPTAASMKGGA